MKTESFNYLLPEELIAFHPPKERDGGRLLVLKRGLGEIIHGAVRDLPRWLPEGALLVVNDTKVIKARLEGRRPTGGRVEVLIISLAPTGERRCRVEALLKANRPIRVGDRIDLGEIGATVLTRGDWGGADLGINVPLERLRAYVDVCGEGPLPPYIRRAPNSEDVDRYQTVYAEHDGSVAAPTAGLHFTRALIDEIRNAGVEIASVTLHVGPGTFRPVVVEDLDEHRMDSESYILSEAAVTAINHAKGAGRPVVAVGTTVTRALEGAVRAKGCLTPGVGRTELFITPEYEFQVIDGLMTNFHLPKSTLLCLVSALAGQERIMAAYREAIEQRYRFYSYGDAMLILPNKR